MSDSRLPSVANESNSEKNSLLDENKESSGDDWRNGPAKYWYDFIDLPQDCHQYDYGFKLKTDSLDNSIHCESVRNRIDSEDAFHLVSQTNWEKDVIWNADHVRHQVLKLIDKTSIAGWIPVEDNRKAPNFVKKLKITNDSNNNSNNSVVINDNIICDNNKNSNSCIKNSSRKLRNRKSLNCYKVDAIRVSHSIKDTQQSYEWVTSLPEENKELVVNRWEDAVIWDSDAMDTIPEPKVIPFHPSDDCLIFSRVLSEDTNDSSQTGDAFKTLVNNFNISNDEFYASISKADNNSSIYVYIQHSIPALTLHPIYFPTCVRDHNHFYRPLLKKSKILISKKQHNVLLCHKLIKQKEIKCESESHTLTDLSHFLIKSPKDLTACDGDIVLMEYSEEDPPLLMRNGMGSKIINYFKVSLILNSNSIIKCLNKYFFIIV
jgi:transcription initiation factor TFIID subunit 1